MGKTDFLSLATEGVQGLSPYQPGKPVDTLRRELGLTDIIKLASNENPLGPGSLALDAIGRVNELGRYPDGSGFRLKAALADHLAVDPDQITLGNGSNDVLELIARTFAGPGQEVIFSQYAFAVYPLATQVVGATPVVTEACDWGHDLVAMRDAIGPKTRLVFIANPNNPTGTWLAGEALDGFLASVPPEVIVVLDEAYFEYGDPQRMGDGIALQRRYSNLIVTRTFSKAHGLAGLRVGYSVSDPAIADLLNRVRQPFNVNTLALVAAEAALADQDHLAGSVALNRNGLADLGKALEERRIDFIPSVGNFISAAFPGRADAVAQSLLRHGVIVRPLGNYRMPDHLRISIGTRAEMERFITTLDEVLNP